MYCIGFDTVCTSRRENYVQTWTMWKGGELMPLYMLVKSWSVDLMRLVLNWCCLSMDVQYLWHFNRQIKIKYQLFSSNRTFSSDKYVAKLGKKTEKCLPSKKTFVIALFTSLLYLMGTPLGQFLCLWHDFSDD